MNIVKEKWAEILDNVRVEHELTDVSFKTWIKPLKFLKMEDSTVTVLVPSESGGLDYINYINKKYYLPLKVAISEAAGKDIDIVFVTSEDINKNDNSEASIEKTSLSGLNPKYTFETFVVGKNNEFAHAASLAVAESPGKLYNPLFLYGGVGLGKTHLMHSIAHFINETRPDLKILYVTSEEFTNQVIEAIRNGSSTTLTKFREKYRNIDVLLVDDVQFIIGKESTQEEFFHTFNALHSAGKQIVLSSDRPPKDMDILEERIRSRFEWGLMADIQSPDYETRTAILKRKMDIEGYYVGNEVIEYIAENARSNIRELEGSLNKVVALSNIEKTEATVEMAQRAMADILNPDDEKEATPEDIIRYVADHYNISPEDIKGEKRSNKIAYPRQISMYLIRELTNTTLQGIGKIMGGKHHTTISYGIENIEAMMEKDPEIKETINKLKKHFK